MKKKNQITAKQGAAKQGTANASPAVSNQRPASRSATKRSDSPISRVSFPFSYSPEIEARREPYMELAASIKYMIDLEMARSIPLLDVTPDELSIDDPPNTHIFMGAINLHLAEVCKLVDWYTPAALRLYAEIRLLIDQQTLDRHNAAPQYQEDEED